MRALNTADVFAFVRVIREAGMEETLKKEFADLIDGKKKITSEELVEAATANQSGILLAVISGFSRKGAEREFYEFISGPFEMTPEEIEKQDASKTLEMLFELTSGEGWTNFFDYAAKLAVKLHK